jgi:hypothetical protein
MSMAAVFLEIEEAFDTTWYSGLPNKLSEFRIFDKPVAYLTDTKFKVLVEGEFSTSRNILAGLPQGSVLVPILHSLYVNDAPAAPGTHFALFVDDSCIYVTEKHEHYVLCELQVLPHCSEFMM